MRIYVIGGRSKSGKDTVAKTIDQYLKQKNQKGAIIQYSYYIKEYAKKITGWDGSDKGKPRTLLQQLGSDIRDKINKNIFVNRMLEDIKIYSDFLDYLIISDARTIDEIENLKEALPNVISIHVVRPNFDNGLSEEQKKHVTENELEHYMTFDYQLVNDKTKEDLIHSVNEIMEEIK